MKILVTGANGYIGKRLIPYLLEAGHQVVAQARYDKKIHLKLPENVRPNLTTVAVDFTKAHEVRTLPKDIDAAYYLLHSLGESPETFEEIEQTVVMNFVDYINQSNAKQIIYLGGISHDENLSPHLRSRKRVKHNLMHAKVPATALEAGIIIGSGSRSFELIRDLVEKLPFMITPKWLNSHSQPIAVLDVIFYLTSVLGDERTYGQTFEMGGPDVLTFKEMLLEYARVRNLKRRILTLPILTPKLSSYWCYFVSSVNYTIAKNLVSSLKNDVVCSENKIRELYPRDLFNYETALKRCFNQIEEHAVVSSWKDGWHNPDIKKYMRIPKNGCYKNLQIRALTKPREEVIKRIWSIGGKNGWYAMDWAWTIRGFIDKCFGGVGIRRGRRDPEELESGDALDFWRVIVADKEDGRLLLYAEMKVPGEAWLEFHIRNVNGKDELHQLATFRPKGLFGRLYWYIFYPFHLFIFPHMARTLVNG